MTVVKKIRALFDNLYFDNWLFTVLQRSPLHKENLVIYRKGNDDLIQAQLPENNLIDVCKTDVERAEYDIFYSGACEAIRRVRFLLIEIHPHQNFQAGDLIEKIGSHGFERISGEATDGGASVYLFKNGKIT